MKIGYGVFESLIFVSRRLTKEIFVELAGVEQGSFAASMFERVYDSVFQESFDVTELYEKYYKAEYKNINLFLYHKYLINEDGIDWINEQLTKDPDLTLRDWKELEQGDDPAYSFMTFYDVEDMISNMFMMKRADYEDKD